MKVALVGPYPPPYGGISSHVQRLADQLNQEDMHVSVYKNMSARRWILSARGKWWNYDVVHFNDIYWIDRLLIGLLNLVGIKTILTIHGDSLKIQANTLNPIQIALLGFGLRRIEHIIIVKSDILLSLLAMGVKEQRISTITAYLPPKKEVAAINDLPIEVRQFIQSHKPLITANAFRIIPQGDQDLYGVELTIELCCSLSKEYPNIGVLCFLAQIGNMDHYQQLVEKIELNNLSNHFHFVIGQPLIPALSISDLFLRPTFSDGYSVSLAEAIELGIPAIASDVALRTPGTILFRTGDLNDYISKVSTALKISNKPKEQKNYTEGVTNLRKIVEIYKVV